MASDRASENSIGFSRWSRVSLRARGVAVLVFPMAVLFAALFTVYWAEMDVQSSANRLLQSYAARADIARLRSAVSDALTAFDGYQATGQERFLKAGSAALISARAVLASLPEKIADSPTAHSEMAQIRLLAEKLLDGMDRAAGTPPGLRTPAAAAGSPPAAELESHLAALDREQEQLLAQAESDRESARRKLFRTLMICGVVGPLGALFIHLLVAGRLVRRIQLVEENARRMAHGLPLEPVPHGSDELASLARQLEDAAYLLRDREREVRESERRYRDLFNQAPIPYEETDREGVVTRFNQAVCTLLKCTPDQILGRHAWDFVAPDETESFRTAMLERIAKGAETGPFECDYMLEDGTRIAVEIRENLIHNEKGQVTGVCRSLMDVTERNLAVIAARKVEQYAMELRNKNEQLGRALDTARSATEAKSRFLASVSHELRTPLNGIIGFSEMMYDGRLGPMSEDQRDVMSDILTSARHLLQLINDILDLSKVEAGRMEFRPEPCLLETVVEEVKDIVRPLAEKKNIQIATEFPPGLTANIDPSRFKQVLYNYLSNAVKFTGNGGSVSVRLSVENDNNFRLEVADTGCGIPEPEVARLFQEFQQLPNSRKAGQGTGLGLALTRHIVEAQGGTVGVQSQLGQGSVFYALLPLHATGKAEMANRSVVS